MRPRGSTYYQDPMLNICMSRNKQRSGNVTWVWKCWWYNADMKRQFKSFACAKHGYQVAKRKCLEKLRSINYEGKH